MSVNRLPLLRFHLRHVSARAAGMVMLLLLTGGTAYGDWNIVWSDEFNGISIDTNHWQFDIGNGAESGIPGWGNNELEYYTARPTNAYVANGILHLAARQESYGGFNYTSARMKTQSLFTKKYGRFEFRASLPQGQGYWPALWLLPQDSVYGTWAASGEIDVMENKGSTPTAVGGTIHYGGQWPNNTYTTETYTLPGGSQVTNFHVYALEWTTNSIRWLVDGQPYQTLTNWWSSGGAYPAPFDQPFYIILNLAVGGNYGGNPDGSTAFPGDMQLDYVRVYDNTAPLRVSVTRTNAKMMLAWPTNIVCHLQSNTSIAPGASDWTGVIGATNPFLLSPSSNGSATYYRLVSP